MKDPAAVTLGRRGGLKGGLARARAMTLEQRSEAARTAARARWNGPDPKKGMVAVGQIGGKGFKHIATETDEGVWYALCRIVETHWVLEWIDGTLPCGGSVTCPKCIRLYKLFKQLMEGTS